jgi:PAS domain S-box-containing protein
VENEELLVRVRAFLRHKQSLDALRSSEARYRFLYEGNRLPMWIYDVGTYALLDVNDAAVAHFGYSRDEFARYSLPDLVVEEEREEFLHALRDASPRAREECWRYRRKDSEVIEVEISEQDLSWNGRAARAVVLYDVTTRNRIDREQRAIIDRYERELRSLKSLSGFRPETGTRALEPASNALLTGRIELFTRRYVQLVERALEQKIYKVDHDVSAELRRLASDLFALTASPRDVVELHCAAMQQVVPEPTAPQAQGLLESGRLVIVELMGYVLAAYRSFFLEQTAARR